MVNPTFRIKRFFRAQIVLATSQSTKADNIVLSCASSDYCAFLVLFKLSRVNPYLDVRTLSMIRNFVLANLLLFFLLLVTVSSFRKRQNLFCRHNFYERNRTNFVLLPHQQYLALPKSSMIVFINYWSFQIIIYSKRNIICHNRALLWKAYPNN